MTSVAQTFDMNLPVHEQIFRQAPYGAIYNRVNQFIALLQQQAPVIVLDGQLLGSKIPVYHPRGEWSGIFNMLG